MVPGSQMCGFAAKKHLYHKSLLQQFQTVGQKPQNEYMQVSGFWIVDWTKRNVKMDSSFNCFLS